jgi:hypothetical protein
VEIRGSDHKLDSGQAENCDRTRFVGARVNFALGAAVKSMGTLGTPVALTAIVFGLGLLIIPLAVETKGEHLPG